MHNRTLIWAHRGASEFAPENTLASFALAIEQGADGIELDVQETRDHELVVVHDETLERVSDGTGWVKDYTYEELLRLNFNRQFPEYGVQRIPTLREVYELVKDTPLTVNVELKTGIVFYPGIEERVLRLTKECGMENCVIYSSFNHETLLRIHSLNPEAKTGVLYSDGIIDAPRYADETVGAEAVHPALYNVQFPGFFESCRERELKVHVWTVNEESYMRMLCENRADAMITNNPKLALEVVRSFS